MAPSPQGYGRPTIRPRPQWQKEEYDTSVLSSLRSVGLDSSASTFRIALSLGFPYHCFTCRRDGREPHGSRLAFTRPARLLACQGFTPGQGNLLPSIGPVGSFGLLAHIPPLDRASSTDDYQQRYAGDIFHGQVNEDDQQPTS